MEETPNQNTTQNISNPANETKSSKAGIAIIALAVLALCGIGFGVYEFVQNNDLQTKNNELQNTIKEYESSSSLKDEDKETDADIADSANANEEVSDNYLEIPEWGIKIKMPDDIYISANKLNGGFYDVWGYSITDDTPIKYEDIDANNGMARLIKFDSQNDYDSCRASCGEVVFTNNQGNTFAFFPRISAFGLSDDEEKIAEEKCNILKQIFSNPNNYSDL